MASAARSAINGGPSSPRRAAHSGVLEDLAVRRPRRSDLATPYVARRCEEFLRARPVTFGMHVIQCPTCGSLARLSSRTANLRCQAISRDVREQSGSCSGFAGILRGSFSACLMLRSAQTSELVEGRVESRRSGAGTALRRPGTRAGADGGSAVGAIRRCRSPIRSQVDGASPSA